MLRFLNIAVLSLLVSAAAWAYQTKYETIFFAEQVKKLEAKVEREKDQIAILKAEWQLLNRPLRMEQLAEQYAADLKPIKPTQVARAQDLPERNRNPVDQIGAKLDTLGLTTGALATPRGPASPGATPLPRPASPNPIARARAAAVTPLAKAVRPVAATPIPRAARPAAATPIAAPGRPVASAPPLNIRHGVTPAAPAVPPVSQAVRPSAGKPPAR